MNIRLAFQLEIFVLIIRLRLVGTHYHPVYCLLLVSTDPSYRS